MDKTCPYLEFFWSVFSCIRTEYGPEKLQIQTFAECVIASHPMFYLMIWRTCTCRALVPYYRTHLVMCFMQQGVKFTEGFKQMTRLLLAMIWYTHSTNWDLQTDAYISTSPAMCSQQLSALNEWLTAIKTYCT